jgi:hypothetical protein
MSSQTAAPPGEVVAVAVLHAGDEILLPDHGALVLVVIRRVLHGSTGASEAELGHNFALCDWQAEADPAERGTACFADEDTVTRLHEGLAA